MYGTIIDTCISSIYAKTPSHGKTDTSFESNKVKLQWVCFEMLSFPEIFELRIKLYNKCLTQISQLPLSTSSLAAGYPYPLVAS